MTLSKNKFCPLEDVSHRLSVLHLKLSGAAGVPGMGLVPTAGL